MGERNGDLVFEGPGGWGVRAEKLRKGGAKKGHGTVKVDRRPPAE